MRNILIIICLLFFFTSCGKLQGDFAYKSFLKGTYKKVTKDQKFSIGEEIKWIFKFNNVYGRHNIGVILMKKELIWVEIKSRIDYIDLSKKIIYGTIRDLAAGSYRILLTNPEDNNSIIASCNFMIYFDDIDRSKE